MIKMEFVGTKGEVIAVNRRIREIAKNMSGRKMRNRDEMLDFVIDSLERDGLDAERVLKRNGINTANDFFSMLYTIQVARRSGLLFERGAKGEA